MFKFYANYLSRNHRCNFYFNQKSFINKTAHFNH